MSEFKVGDRVRGSHWKKDQPRYEEGIVEGVLEHRDVLPGVSFEDDKIHYIRTDDGRAHPVWTETLEAAAPFRLGDRVRYTGKKKDSFVDWSLSPKLGRTGVVINVGKDTTSVRFDDGELGGNGIFHDNLELLLEPVKPAVGDRVRVVHEGVVVFVGDRASAPGEFNGLSVKTDSGAEIYAGKATTSVEILERKPEPEPERPKPGTVAVRGSAVVYVQLPSGQVQAIYLDHAEGKDFVQTLSGSVADWGEVIHEPQDDFSVL